MRRRTQLRRAGRLMASCRCSFHTGQSPDVVTHLATLPSTVLGRWAALPLAHALEGAETEADRGILLRVGAVLMLREKLL